MKSLLRPLLAAGLTVGTGLVLSTGCVDNRASIYIGGVLVPQPPQCTVTADPTAAQFPSGVLDLSAKRSYQAALLVANQLTPRGEKVQAKAETMRIALNAAEITLLNAAGEQFTCPDDDECAHFSVFGTGFISVARAEDPAYGLFSAQLIPPIVADTILPDIQATGAQRLVAVVKVRGETLGGKEIETGEFIFPIDVCYGCLIAYNNGPCCLSTPGTGAELTVCYAGQDTAFPCTACSNGEDDNICYKPDPSVVCPATDT